MTRAQTRLMKTLVVFLSKVKIRSVSYACKNGRCNESFTLGGDAAECKRVFKLHPETPWVQKEWRKQLGGKCELR